MEDVGPGEVGLTRRLSGNSMGVLVAGKGRFAETRLDSK